MENPEQEHDYVKSAIESGLYESPQWIALVHYRPRAFGGYESLVGDPLFFLHPEGKRNPQAELEATLAALSNSDTPLDESHPACRFPARRRWLVESLGIPEGALPAPECPELKEFIKMVSPKSATLVFPEAHMNSPASMFGHTLIRVDSGLESSLVSHAINYAAFTDETFGPFYAVRGIFGFYKGYFSVLPYYERINRYSNMENRDIWEYRLNLTEQEVMMMTLHVWEMRELYSYYYFFDENCSYILLYMLEAARPGSGLTEGFGSWAIPIDTIRQVRSAGLVEDVTYRPSRAARLMHISSLSTPGQRGRAKAIALGKEPPTEVEDEGERELAIRTLDMATEYLKYRYEQQELEKDEYTGRLIEILAQRSLLGKHDYEIPAPARPEAGHGSARLALGWGYLLGNQKDEPYARLRLRPAFHGLEDPEEGFTPGAAISFFDLEARYYPDLENELVLERLDLIDITSLALIGDFFRQASWKVNTGLEREELPGGGARTPYGLYVATGLAAGSKGGAMLYGFTGPSAKVDGELGQENYAAGLRATAGALIPVGRRYRAMVEADGASYRAGLLYKSMSLKITQTLRLGKDHALVLEARRRGVEHLWTTDLSLLWNIYF